MPSGTPKRDLYDPHGVRVSTFLAVKALAEDEAAPVRFRSAMVENLIERLDRAKTPVEFDMQATRRAIVFLLQGRLLTNAGQTNRYSIEECTTAEVVYEVMAERIIRHGVWEVVPARGKPGWSACPACGFPVDPAALAGTRSTAHPECDPDGKIRALPVRSGGRN